MLAYPGSAPLAHSHHLEVGFGKITEPAVPQYLCIHGDCGISSLLDLTLFWMTVLKRKGFPFHQGNTVSSLLHVATAEFISEIMLCPVRRGWCPDQARETLSQCGTVHPMLVFCVIHHPSMELSISWGGGGRGKRSRGR